MPHRTPLTIVTAALLLQCAALVAAHGDEHMDMDSHDVAAATTQQDGPAQSYWRLSEHAPLMYWHIGLEILAWIFVLPVAVMFSIARSRLTIPTQLLFLAINALALTLGLVYDRQTPQLYANNAHGKTGWIITWLASAWALVALMQAYAGRASSQSLNEEEATHLMTSANMARYQRVHDAEATQFSRWSNDSGQGTERNSASLVSHSRSPSVESEDQGFVAPIRGYAEQHEDGSLQSEAEKHVMLRGGRVDGFLSRYMKHFAGRRTMLLIRILYVVFERTLVIQGFVAIATGTVVYGGIGKGSAVFNVLAHYIKGGLFFLYGLLTLGRWMGAFADCGWAWNVKPSREVVGRRCANMPSAEFVESFVIFLYGVTNVFLEHLAAWGEAWTPQDLEHVSISVMFFGGGLLGMIIESTKMRKLLDNTISTSSQSTHSTDHDTTSPRPSLNPAPALIILLLGKMMSAHHQASHLSTTLHSQWGTLFIAFSLTRFATYALLYLSPPTSILPSRPPTEVLGAFCLVSGGITFVLSNKDSVAALEEYGVDGMVAFTVTMGSSALVMAWAAVVLGVKGWAVGVEMRRRVGKSGGLA